MDPFDHAIAAYCQQLPTADLIALANAEPKAIQLAIDAVHPRSLLDDWVGPVLPWRAAKD